MDAAARLLIHLPGGSGRRLGAALQRLWMRAIPVAPLPELQIHDLHGRRQLALAEIGPLVDIALTPGVYHVTVERSGCQRRYTVTLVQGRAVDLHLDAAVAPAAPRLDPL